MATSDVTVPDIGDYHDIPVIEVLVHDGDTVTKDQPLIVLESDKATMEVPSPDAGVVRGMKVKVGDKVSKGDRICRLEGEGAAAASAPEKPAAAEKAPKAEKPAKAEKAKGPDLFSDGAPPPGPSSQPAPASGSAAASGSIAVTVPDIGNYSGVPVIEVLVKDGDTVAKDQSLITLESDKSTMDVPSPAAGVVRGLKVKVDDKLSKGDPICTLEGAGDGEAPAKPAPSRSPDEVREAPAKKQAPAKKEAPAEEPTASAPPANVETPSAPPTTSSAHAGPATRKFARELGVDLGQVKGSGPKGRVVIEDVQAFVKGRMSGAPAVPAAAAAPASGGAGIPPIPPQDFSLYGEIETKPLARIRKLSAAHLHRSWLNIPHVTQTDEADITDLEAFRKSATEETGTKLTLLPFVMKAVAIAMKQYPEFNSSLSPDGGSLIFKKYCHLGFAADTPNGLVVPVVRDVWSKGITALATECAELASKARDGKLKPDEMKGGCFSISSLGGIGGSHFTPIVNAPDVGILGVSRGTMKPIWDGAAFQPRLMLPLSLSYDHRVIDGAYAARFIVALARLLADVRRLSL